MSKAKFLSDIPWLSSGIIFLLVASIFLGLTSCHSKSNLFYGEIPVGFTQEIRWEKTGPDYDPVGTIDILIKKNGKMDTVKALFNPYVLLGGFMIEYRNSYPPTKNQTVFVRGYYDDGRPYITEAYSRRPEDYK